MKKHGNKAHDKKRVKDEDLFDSVSSNLASWFHFVFGKVLALNLSHGPEDYLEELERIRKLVENWHGIEQEWS